VALKVQLQLGLRGFLGKLRKEKLKDEKRRCLLSFFSFFFFMGGNVRV
jgi:hypothetical protein